MTEDKTSFADIASLPNSMEELWMPFTPQRFFKKAPRMVVSAKGMYYYDADGKEILDAAAGLWCVNAGHNRPEIKAAIAAQLEHLDYAPCFQLGNPVAFKAASRLISVMPKGFSHVFFSNSGSEAVDTALKIVLAYNKIRGKGNKKVLIGREQSYHGVGFGGISVGGIPYVRTQFTQLLPDVDHIPNTTGIVANRFSRGEPHHGIDLAETLVNRIELHGAENVAAVIVEPVTGAPGVYPSPKGYMKRLREICTKHDILLIFDEVVTGFGRLGDFSASTYLGVEPDIITMAKGITNATVPLGATFVKAEIYDEFMKGNERATEFLHGYTYSGHPVACAAALATLEAYQNDKIMENAKAMAPKLEEALHSLKDLPRLVDIRNIGILGALQFEAGPADDPYYYSRSVSYELFRQGAFIRHNGTNLLFSPPLILNESHIDRMMTLTRKVVKEICA